MYSSREKALLALTHCVNLDNPFASCNCGEGCPLWNQCYGELDVILSDLLEVLLSMNIPPDRTDRLFSAMPRCYREQLCNGSCPYWKKCRGENIHLLFRDIYDLMKEFGAYETTSEKTS